MVIGSAPRAVAPGSIPGRDLFLIYARALGSMGGAESHRGVGTYWATATPMCRLGPMVITKAPRPKGLRSIPGRDLF